MSRFTKLNTVILAISIYNLYHKRIIIISQFLTSRLISPDDGFILRFDSAANPGTSVLIMIPPAYALPPQVRPRKDNVDKR